MKKVTERVCELGAYDTPKITLIDVGVRQLLCLSGEGTQEVQEGNTDEWEY